MHQRLKVELVSPAEQAAQKLTSSLTFDELANAFEIRRSDLAWVVHRKRVESYYKTFNVAKKSGGVREIAAPSGSLKILQTKLLAMLEVIYRPKPSVHAFTKGRSIVTNASQHEGRRWIANIDLKDFYPCIHFGRVRGLFLKPPFADSDAVATVLAQLVTYNKVLPQGAPTSPILANMICRGLDNDLQQLAHARGCRYTRYADDMTFSTGSSSFPTALVYRDPEAPQAQVGEELHNCIKKHGFVVNPAKVRLASRKERQIVTGLTVNQVVNVKRKLIKEVRAILHAIEKHGLDAAQSTFETEYDIRRRKPRKKPVKLARVLKGKIDFIGMVKRKDSRTYRDLRLRYERIVNGKEMDLEANDEARQPDVFVCHASTDKKDVVTPLCHHLRLQGIKPWLDSEQIKWGDDIVKAIGEGLVHAKYVLVVLSFQSIGRPWQETEINNALAIEINDAKKRVLPLLVGSSEEIQVILRKFPLLSARSHKRWKQDPQVIASELKALLAS